MNAFSHTAVASAAGASSADSSPTDGAYLAASFPPADIDMRPTMRRLYTAAKTSMLAAGEVSVTAGKRLIEMMRSLWDVMVSFMRRIARKLGASVSAPDGADLTERQAIGDADLSATAESRGAPAGALMLSDGRDPGGDVADSSGLGQPAAVSSFSPGFDLDKEFNTVVPPQVVAGAIEEKVGELAGHIEQQGRPCLSMLADPETATMWATLSLEQLEQVRYFHEQQIHARREEMEKLVSDLSVQESASPEAVVMLLESSGAPALDPQGRYQVAKEWIIRATAELGTVEMAMKAILAMPAAELVPQELRRDLCTKLGINFESALSGDVLSDAAQGDVSELDSHSEDRQASDTVEFHTPKEISHLDPKLVVNIARMDNNTKSKSLDRSVEVEDAAAPSAVHPPPPESSPMSRVVQESVFAQRLMNSRRPTPDSDVRPQSSQEFNPDKHR